MKITKLIIILFLTSFSACKQDKSSKNIDIIKNDIIEEYQVYTKVDTINGKAFVDNRCGVGAPYIKIFNDSIFYYYPIEGSYYKINEKTENKDSITFNTSILPSDNSLSTIFKIVKIDNSLLRIYIDEIYSGSFINSTFIGKRVTIFKDKNCEEDSVNNNKETSNLAEYPIFQNSTWYYNCKASDYVTFTIDIVQFNFYEMDIGINTKIKKNNESEFDFYFKSPPIAPIPDDMDWENYSQKEKIAKINYSKGIMYFTWYGFFNEKTKKREYLENPFTNKIEKESIILKKCE